MSAKLSNSFLFLAVGVLMLFSPLAGKSQNSFVVNLAETKWSSDPITIPDYGTSTAITTLTRYINFYKQGKVEAAIAKNKTAGFEYQYVWDNVYVGGTIGYEKQRVQQRVQTLPESNVDDWKGTYEIKGKSVYLDFPNCTIEAKISGGSLNGVLIYKGSEEKEIWTLSQLTSSQNNSNGGNTRSDNLLEKRQLVETLSAKAEGLWRQATDLESKGKTFESQKKYLEAIDALDTVIETELDTKQYVIKSYISRAEIKIRLQDFRGVIEDCSSAIELSTPFKKKVMEMRAEAKAKLKDDYDPLLVAGALVELREELRKKEPEISAAMDGLEKGYYYRYLAKVELGDKKGADEDVRMLDVLGFK